MRKEFYVKDTQNIEKISEIIKKYDYDIWIHSKSGMVDAKSPLGTFAFSLKNQMYLITEDDIDATNLLKDLSEFLDFYD